MSTANIGRIPAASGNDIGFYVENNGSGDAMSIGSGATAQVRYSLINWNYGSGYDTGTNRFYAPVDGIYQFNVNYMVTSYTGPDSERWDSGMRLNGSAYIFYTLREWSAMNAFRAWNFTTCAKMTQGQYMDVIIVNQTATTRALYAGTQYTNWSGALLSAVQF